MANNKNFDVIIIGGSYAGLSAAMALGRSLRSVLIIDSGKPCNMQTPHSHNFITQDGKTPKQITEEAKQQVLKYDTVTFCNDTALDGKKTGTGFEISTLSGAAFTAGKLIFSTGVKDQMPAMNGFAECWGISVLHCPYCHGYEVKGEAIGLFGNGDMGFEFCKLISNWTKNLRLFTDGPSTLTKEQTEAITAHGINITESEIEKLEHTNRQISHIVFKDGSKLPVAAVFARADFKQHCDIPAQLGCEFTEQGFIAMDEFQQTTVKGVYVAGDNSTMLRTVSVAVAAGTRAGAFVNRELINERF